MGEIPSVDYSTRRINNSFDSIDFIKDLYENIRKSFGEEYLYKYFSDIYDELFTNLALKKTFISSRTRKMLEVLSTPIYKKDKLEKEKIYKELEKI